MVDKFFSVNIDGVEQGRLNLDVSKRENQEMLFRLFGFEKVRTDGNKAYKKDQHTNNLYENYKTNACIDYKAIANGLYTVENLSDSEQVRSLLRKGLEDYYVTAAPVTVMVTSSRLTQIKNAIASAITEDEKKAAQKQKYDYIQSEKMGLLNPFSTNIERIMTECNNLIGSAGLTREQELEVRCIVKDIIDNAFNVKTIWNILNIENLDDRNRAMESKIVSTAGVISFNVNDYITKVKQVIIVPPTEPIVPQEQTVQQPPVVDPNVQPQSTIIIQNQPSQQQTQVNYTPPPLVRPILQLTPMVNFQTLYNTDIEARRLIVKRVNHIFNSRDFITAICEIQPDPRFIFVDINSPTDFKLVSTVYGYKSIKIIVSDAGVCLTS